MFYFQKQKKLDDKVWDSFISGPIMEAVVDAQVEHLFLLEEAPPAWALSRLPPSMSLACLARLDTGQAWLTSAGYVFDLAPEGIPIRSLYGRRRLPPGVIMDDPSVVPQPGLSWRHQSGPALSKQAPAMVSVQHLDPSSSDIPVPTSPSAGTQYCAAPVPTAPPGIECPASCVATEALPAEAPSPYVAAAPSSAALLAPLAVDVPTPPTLSGSLWVICECDEDDCDDSDDDFSVSDDASDDSGDSKAGDDDDMGWDDDEGQDGADEDYDDDDEGQDGDDEDYDDDDEGQDGDDEDYDDDDEGQDGDDEDYDDDDEGQVGDGDEDTTCSPHDCVAVRACGNGTAVAATGHTSSGLQENMHRKHEKSKAVSLSSTLPALPPLRGTACLPASAQLPSSDPSPAPTAYLSQLPSLRLHTMPLNPHHSVLRLLPNLPALPAVTVVPDTSSTKVELHGTCNGHAGVYVGQ